MSKRGEVTILVHDAEALDGMPDETLIRASGRYVSGGTFIDCWARPLPQNVSGTAARAWEVLTFGSQLPYSLTTVEDITYPVEVLYVDLDSIASSERQD